MAAPSGSAGGAGAAVAASAATAGGASFRGGAAARAPSLINDPASEGSTQSAAAADDAAGRNGGGDRSLLPAASSRLAPAPLPTNAPPLAGPPPPPFVGYSCLVVDDVLTNRKLTAMMLGKVRALEVVRREGVAARGTKRPFSEPESRRMREENTTPQKRETTRARGSRSIAALGAGEAPSRLSSAQCCHATHSGRPPWKRNGH